MTRQLRSFIKRRAQQGRRASEVVMQDDEQRKADVVEAVYHDSATAFNFPEHSRAEEMRCLQCGAPVRNVVCGRRQPCAACGFPYPLGDCSDLAEN